MCPSTKNSSPHADALWGCTALIPLPGWGPRWVRCVQCDRQGAAPCQPAFSPTTRDLASSWGVRAGVIFGTAGRPFLFIILFSKFTLSWVLPQIYRLFEWLKNKLGKCVCLQGISISGVAASLWSDRGTALFKRRRVGEGDQGGRTEQKQCLPASLQLQLAGWVGHCSPNPLL